MHACGSRRARPEKRMYVKHCLWWVEEEKEEMEEGNRYFSTCQRSALKPPQHFSFVSICSGRDEKEDTHWRVAQR
jgi:hypothetical protein